MLLKVSEPVEKDNIAGRTGSSGPPGLEPWLFSKRFTRLVEQNLNLCVATVGSLMVFLYDRRSSEICSPVFDCWSLMFQSPEKHFNKKRVGHDVYYYHKDFYTAPPVLASTEPNRQLSGAGWGCGFRLCVTSSVGGAVHGVTVTAAVSTLLLGWRSTVSQNNDHIGGVDFLRIIFFFGLFSFELIALLFCVKFCATKFFFPFHHYLWCNLSRRVQHCVVGLRVGGFCNDTILASARF